MAEAIKGKDFELSIEVNGVMTLIACATDCQINQTFGVKETSGVQGKWREYIGEYNGYTITCPALYVPKNSANYLQVEEAGQASRVVAWQATDAVLGNVVHKGFILFTSLNLQSQFRDAVKCDWTAIGTGPKTTEKIDTVSVVYLADENKERLFGCPNPYPISVFWYTSDGNGQGVYIGSAENPDDVVQIYNNYSENGGLWTLSLGPSGCDFNLVTDWEAPFVPEVVFAIASPDLGLSPNLETNEGLSPDIDNDQLTSPYYA